MIFNLLFYTMFFWVFIDMMPGLESPNGVFGDFLAAVVFSCIYNSLPSILKFFKFPVNFWGKFFFGTLLTTVYLIVLTTVLPQVLAASPGYVGGSNLIFFTLPKILILPSAITVIFFTAVASTICSIMLDRYTR